MLWHESYVSVAKCKPPASVKARVLILFPSFDKNFQESVMGQGSVLSTGDTSVNKEGKILILWHLYHIGEIKKIYK